MILSEKTARNLIHEISSVIDYDINIMNEKGAIIASTDPDRKGQFHEAAYRIINNDLTELLVYYDEEYDGCKKGINFPIINEGEIIGAIGITGEVDETIGYGKLIKKFAEILMHDLANLERQNRTEQSKFLFVNEWLSGEIQQESEIQRRIKKYNFTLNASYQIAIIKNLSKKTVTWDFLSSKMDRSHALTSYNNDFGIAVCNFSTSEKCGEYLSSRFSEKYPAEDFICAIGNSYRSLIRLPESYNEALITFHSIDTENSGIYFYNDTLLDIILDNVPDEYKKKFSSYIFRNCTEKEISEFTVLINIYLMENGSINTISKKLFIHKNTVQYKINKIMCRTGLDPRDLKDLQKLVLAARWHTDVSDSPI